MALLAIKIHLKFGLLTQDVRKCKLAYFLQSKRTTYIPTYPTDRLAEMQQAANFKDGDDYDMQQDDEAMDGKK